MRTRIVLLVVGSVAFLGCGGGISDPSSARCANPHPAFEMPAPAGDHVEATAHFTCEGIRLAGTLYLPATTGRHPAVVWVHGSGEQPRLNYGSIVAPLVGHGIAVFSYDKRGAGESQGKCCLGSGHYNLLAADAAGAVVAVRTRAEVDPARVGFYGASEAGWVVPLANARLREPVAFTALVDAPTVTTGEEKAWGEAAGEDEPGPLTPTKKRDATRRLKDTRPSGFDPAPYIQRMQTPGLWLYGGADKSIPTDRCVAVLNRLRHGKRFTVIVFPGAGHGLVDRVPTAPAAPATLTDWIEKTARRS